MRQQRRRHDDHGTGRDEGGQQSPQAQGRIAGHSTHRRDRQGTEPNDRSPGTAQT